MKKDVMEKWVKALRSGEYIQGDGMLRQVDDDDNGNPVVKHCCLGVLCEIVGVEYSGQDGLPPEKAYKAAGITTYDKEDELGPQLPKRYKTKGLNLDSDRLEYLNDNGLSFKEIANIIEKKL